MAEIINQIVIHKKLLDKYKRDGLKKLPLEHLKAILGIVKNGTLYIHVLDDFEEVHASIVDGIARLEYELFEEGFEDSTLTYYGSIHTHPEDTFTPSLTDIRDFRKTYNGREIVSREGCIEYSQDIIMGIMEIFNHKGTYQWALQFYDIDMKIIPYRVSENKRKH